jgi:hypothetical protein
MANYPKGLEIHRIQPIETSEWETNRDPLKDDPKSFELLVLKKNHKFGDVSSKRTIDSVATDGSTHFFIAVDMNSGKHTFKMIKGETADELIKQFPSGSCGIIDKMPEHGEAYTSLTIVPDGNKFKSISYSTQLGIYIDGKGKVSTNFRNPKTFNIKENRYVPTFESFIARRK